jgi:hypothetical protein
MPSAWRRWHRPTGGQAQKDGMHARTPRSVERSEPGSEAVTGETGHAARCSLRFWRIDRYQILPLARSSEASFGPAGGDDRLPKAGPGLKSGSRHTKLSGWPLVAVLHTLGHGRTRCHGNENRLPADPGK